MASNLGSPGVTLLEAPALRADCELLAIFLTPKSFTPGSDIAADLRFALRGISLATQFAGLGANNNLLSFCTRLPNAIRKCLNNGGLMQFKEREDLQVQMFELLCRVVEFLVAMMKSVSEDPSKFPLFRNLVEVLNVVMDTESVYYKLRNSEKDMIHILVDPSRLESLSRFCGISVKVIGSGFFPPTCRQKMKQVGESCPSCIQSSTNDAVILYLRWLMCSGPHGNGYLYILDVLKYLKNSPEDITFLNLGILLQPVAKYCSSFASGRENLEEKLCDVRHLIFQFLEKAVLARHDEFSPNFSTVIAEYAAFQRLIGYLHAVCSSTNMSLAGILQTQAWERGLEHSGQAVIVCAGVDDAVKSTLTPTSGEPSLFNDERDLLSWLNTKDVVFKLLTADYKADNLAKVIEFVATVSARGLILQPVVQRLLKFDHLLKEEQKFVYISIVSSVLEGANLSSYSFHLESIIEWLERRQASPVLSQKLFSILNKLPACDKDRIYETKLLDLFWKHMLVGRPQVLTESHDFANSLINFASHYTLVNNMEHLLDATSQTHDNAKFLRNCFSQEPSSSSKLKLCLEPNQVETYVQKAKFWEEIERDYLVDIPKREQRLEELLNLIPLNRHKILRDCMEWLGLARSLITGFDNISSDAFESSRNAVLLPAEQTLEALKEESSIHFQVGQQFETLSAKQLIEYNEFKRAYYQSLQMFFERCLSEKSDVVKNALYSRAKVVACKERAKILVSNEVSSRDALKRMLQNADDFIKKAKGKRKARPSECGICFLVFNEKRKRACLGPCGHAQACLECANREWERTKNCPMCRCPTEKPIPLNSAKVFF